MPMTEAKLDTDECLTVEFHVIGVIDHLCSPYYSFCIQSMFSCAWHMCCF